MSAKDLVHRDAHEVAIPSPKGSHKVFEGPLVANVHSSSLVTGRKEE